MVKRRPEPQDRHGGPPPRFPRRQFLAGSLAAGVVGAGCASGVGSGARDSAAGPQGGGGGAGGAGGFPAGTLDTASAGGAGGGPGTSVDAAPGADTAGPVDASRPPTSPDAPAADTAGARPEVQAPADQATEAGAALLTGILDTHVHFWDPSRPTPRGRPSPIPWPPRSSPLYKRALPADYESLAAPLGITGAVVVEASPWVEDNDWVLSVIDRHPMIRGYVGNLSESFGTGAFAGHLARLRMNKRFLGIRLAEDGVDRALSSQAAMADLRRLAEAGLMIDVHATPFDALARLAGQVKDLRIVVDHLANARFRPGGVVEPAWAQGVAAVAKASENVFLKVSAYVEVTGSPAGAVPTDVAFYKPVLDAAWAAFGEDRVVFGSNWPVSSPAAPLDVVVKIATAYAGARSEAAARKLFTTNAARAYRPPEL